MFNFSDFHRFWNEKADLWNCESSKFISCAKIDILLVFNYVLLVSPSFLWLFGKEQVRYFDDLVISANLEHSENNVFAVQNFSLCVDDLIRKNSLIFDSTETVYFTRKKEEKNVKKYQYLRNISHFFNHSAS